MVQPWLLILKLDFVLVKDVDCFLRFEGFSCYCCCNTVTSKSWIILFGNCLKLDFDLMWKVGMLLKSKLFQGMLDIALLASNASQLQYLLQVRFLSLLTWFSLFLTTLPPFIKFLFFAKRKLQQKSKKQKHGKCKDHILEFWIKWYCYPNWQFWWMRKIFNFYIKKYRKHVVVVLMAKCADALLNIKPCHNPRFNIWD